MIKVIDAGSTNPNQRFAGPGFRGFDVFNNKLVDATAFTNYCCLHVTLQLSRMVRVGHYSYSGEGHQQLRSGMLTANFPTRLPADLTQMIFKSLLILSALAIAAATIYDRFTGRRVTRKVMWPILIGFGAVVIGIMARSYFD